MIIIKKLSIINEVVAAKISKQSAGSRHPMITLLWGHNSSWFIYNHEAVV